MVLISGFRRILSFSSPKLLQLTFDADRPLFFRRDPEGAVGSVVVALGLQNLATCAIVGEPGSVGALVDDALAEAVDGGIVPNEP